MLFCNMVLWYFLSRDGVQLSAFALACNRWQQGFIPRSQGLYHALSQTLKRICTLCLHSHNPDAHRSLTRCGPSHLPPSPLTPPSCPFLPALLFPVFLFLPLSLVSPSHHTWDISYCRYNGAAVSYQAAFPNMCTCNLKLWTKTKLSFHELLFTDILS